MCVRGWVQKGKARLSPRPVLRYERIQATNTLGVMVSLFSETKNFYQKRKLIDKNSEQNTKQESGPMIRLLPPERFIIAAQRKRRDHTVPVPSEIA